MIKILAVETKLHLRDWPSLIFTIGLPLMLLLIIGSIPALSKPDPKLGGERFIDTQMPSQMAILALMTLAFSVLPGVLAHYRQDGVLRRMSTTPVHPGKLLAAQLVINLAVGAVSTAILIVAGKLVLGSLIPQQMFGFVLVFLLGTAALMAMGLVIASLAPNGKIAPAIGSAVMFPLMFVAGMWIPRDVMPDTLRTISDYSVTGPFAQALRDTWSGHPPQVSSIVVMTVGLLVFGGLAVKLFRWE